MIDMNAKTGLCLSTPRVGSFARRSLLGLGSLLLLAAAPSAVLAQTYASDYTVNPVADKMTALGKDYPAWVDDLFAGATVVTTTGTPASGAAASALPDGTNDDLAAVQSDIDTLSAGGGGIIYFPAGTYHFTGDLILKDGVILVGAVPTTDQFDPISKKPTYNPPSNFKFPRYIFSTGSTDSRTARVGKFAVIRVDSPANASNLGMVNLDIDGARFGNDRAAGELLPMREVAPGTFVQVPITALAGDEDTRLFKNENIIAFGLRVNNASLPEYDIPLVKQNAWQIFPRRFNIILDLFSNRNLYVACNVLQDLSWYVYNGVQDSNVPLIHSAGTINESTAIDPPELVSLSDGSGILADFDMALNDGVSGTAGAYINLDGIENPLPGTLSHFQPGDKVRYRYSDGYGIVANNHAPVATTNSLFLTPISYPHFFRPGVEVCRNWIFNTTRISIAASGYGLKITDNVLRDAVDKIYRINSVGEQFLVVSQARDNVGINPAGIDVTITGNDIERIAGQSGTGVFSNWGVGIRMLPDTSGPLMIKDWNISDNRIAYPANTSTPFLPIVSTSSTANGPDLVIQQISYIQGLTISNNTLEGGSIEWREGNANNRLANFDVTVDSNVLSTISGAGGNLKVLGNLLSRNMQVVNNTIGGDFEYPDYSVTGDEDPNDIDSAFYVGPGGDAGNNTVPGGADPQTVGDGTFDDTNETPRPPELTLLDPTVLENLGSKVGDTLTLEVQVEQDPRTVDPEGFFFGRSDIKQVRFVYGLSTYTIVVVDSNSVTQSTPNQVILLDDGVAPDTTADDGIYTAEWTVPLDAVDQTNTFEATLTDWDVAVIEGEVSPGYVERNWLLQPLPIVLASTKEATGDVPAPEIVSVGVSGTDLVITFTAQDGADYVLLESDTAEDGSFSDSGATESAVVGGQSTFTIPLSGARAFYIVETN